MASKDKDRGLNLGRLDRIDGGGTEWRRPRRARPEMLVEAARGIGHAYEAVAAFRGWSERGDVVQSLRKASVRELATRPETRRLALEPEVLDELLAGLTTLDRGSS